MTVRIETTVIGEYGYEQSLMGLGLSFGLTADTSFEDLKAEARLCKDTKLEKLAKVALKLAPKDGGHNKFLESMQVWIDINAPRYWWSEFDTYRSGVTKQSASTMHTLVKEMEFLTWAAETFITGDDVMIVEHYLDAQEQLSKYYKNNFEQGSKDDLQRDLEAFAHKVRGLAQIEDIAERVMYAKRTLLEGFMQRRIVSTNYKALRNIIIQRRDHRLPHWQMFVKDILAQVEHPELLPSLEIG